jgi:hypothetical protein
VLSCRTPKLLSLDLGITICKIFVNISVFACVFDNDYSCFIFYSLGSFLIDIFIPLNMAE